MGSWRAARGSAGLAAAKCDRSEIGCNRRRKLMHDTPTAVQIRIEQNHPFFLRNAPAADCTLAHGLIVTGLTVAGRRMRQSRTRNAGGVLRPGVAIMHQY